MRQFEANRQGGFKTHLKVARVVDGDGLIAYNIFDKQEIEVRLLGIDAPEIKKCKKLLQDERELHLPGELLIELGRRSFKFLSEIVTKDSNISLSTPTKNEVDLYGRILAYVFLPDGRCLNELILQEGYAKPFDKYECDKIVEFKLLNNEARREKKGLYNQVTFF
jgi:micrococcal nuclease